MSFQNQKKYECYVHKKFFVNVALLDKDFEILKEYVCNLQVDITAAMEHVGELERGICLMKKQRRYSTEEFPVSNS